ncbi:uncharacterized protein LOC128647789 [Bombina bombina]|uniref:uncharacterized protein LOC128647789 n=1 Tax=Bombina bombina TaxID=8345 RepID=UPI00235A92E6|nr:uncharacterized protein LOC128647789 [Bombina bombina]
MKWPGRTSSGSFTKLVNNGCTAPCPGKPGRAGSVAQIESSRLYSDSSASNASYPLTSSAQQQRKFPSCNLKKSCFAFLNGSPECVRVEETGGLHENHNLCHKPQEDFTWSTKSTFPRGGRVKEPPLDLEMAKAVFVICEEADDQQPLVLDDQLSTSGYSQSAKKDSGTIKCKADIHSIKPTEVVSDLGPWINSPEGYRCQHTADMLTLASADNQSKRNSTDIGRHESEFDANSLSQQELTTDRVILKHHTPVCQHAVTSNDLGIPCSSEKTS